MVGEQDSNPPQRFRKQIQARQLDPAKEKAFHFLGHSILSSLGKTCPTLS